MKTAFLPLAVIAGVLLALGGCRGLSGGPGGPIYAGQQMNGSEVTVTFTHAEGGLAAKGGELQGFVIAGDDREWKPALTKIDGGKVIVSTPDGANAAAVRYAWPGGVAGNLTDAAGRPAATFRTDNWPLPAAP